jgi:L-aspartate oxidase
MVFGARLAESILAGGDGPVPTGVMGTLLHGAVEDVESPIGAPQTNWSASGSAADGEAWSDPAKVRDQLQRAMIEGVGVVRSADSLAAAGASVDAIDAVTGSGTPIDRAHGELVNLVTAAKSVLRAATVRCETRGAHARSDFPEASEHWRRRIVHADRGFGLLNGSPAGTEINRETSRRGAGS